MKAVTRAVLAAALAVAALSGPGVAQESVPVATPDTSAPSQRADLAVEMPTNMGGFEPDIVITRGADHLANLDPGDPNDVATAAELGLFEETGVDVAAMTSGYALVSQEDFFAFVVAVRLEGATPGSVLPAYLPILTAGLIAPDTTQATLGGKDVLVLTSEGEGGDFVELYVYSVGDTVWMVQGPLDVVTYVLEDLS